MVGQRKLVMRMSLDVLRHLGLNLYSNVPAALSEIVANAWDADAENVKIKLNEENSIIIEDNGVGMTRNQVIDRFLRIDYQRRNGQPGLTSKGRTPMGRKGIGKLSLFSIARDIVVETIHQGSRTAFRMRLDEIEDTIKDSKNEEYEPEELFCEHNIEDLGTRIVLNELRKRQTISTVEALKTRVARRFSIIGPEHKFSVSVNGGEIGPEDREYYDKLQYIWTYGDQKDVVSYCTNHEDHFCMPNTFSVNDSQDITVNGWLGTVHKSGQLRDTNQENLNRIAIFVRGKMAQEDLLNDFAERGVYASYLIGELHVNGLDTMTGEASDQEDEDSATSSRQHIVEDDPRYVALRDFIRRDLKRIEKQWSDWRIKAGAKAALDIPEVKSWIETLPSDHAKSAKQWLGKLNRLKVNNAGERKTLMKHAVLAFEFHRWNDRVKNLDQIDDNNIEGFITVFREFDALESTLYGQIIKHRLEVIRILMEKVDQNAKEKAIQTYLFDHLWILDPSWERADSSKMMEKRIDKLFKDIEADLPEEEKKGRVDIKYKKTSGKHVIIELKRPDRIVSIYDLAKQIGHYRSGIRSILQNQGVAGEPFEFVCIMGKAPKEWNEDGGPKFVEDMLAPLNARYVNYDELLNNAFQAYSEYLKEEEKVNRLNDVITAIEDYSEE